MSTNNICFYKEADKSMWAVIWTLQPASMAQLDARPTGDQEVGGLTPAGLATFFHGDLIMKYFLGSFSPFRWFKKGSCQFLAKECTHYWLTNNLLTWCRTYIFQIVAHWKTHRTARLTQVVLLLEELQISLVTLATDSWVKQHLCVEVMVSGLIAHQHVS